MKRIASLFLIIFSVFLVAPSLVAFIDDSVDISFAFTANEEENSKTHSEVQLALDQGSNYGSILFLQEQRSESHYYKNDALAVYLEVSSPPPKLYI